MSPRTSSSESDSDVEGEGVTDSERRTNKDGCCQRDGSTLITGAIIVVYTMISTSTANVAVITLPYLNSEFQFFPNLALVSGLMSAAKILSSFLIFVFPTRNYEIMMILGVKAILMTSLSEIHVFLPEKYQGMWIAICIVLLTFSCGSTVARALTITRDEADTKFLSNCFTVGKSSVHAVELLTTTVFFQYYEWDGLVVWICSAYGLVTVSTVAIYIKYYVDKRKNGADKERPRDIEHVPSDIESVTETDLLLYPRHRRHSYGHQSSSSCVRNYSDHIHHDKHVGFDSQIDLSEWHHHHHTKLHNTRRNRTISATSLGSILTTISHVPCDDVVESDSSETYLQLLWKDVSQASLGAWAYLLFSETAGMSLSVIILCGTKYVKEVWHFSPDKAALTIVLPQLMVIPIFCFVISVFNMDHFTKVIFGNTLLSIIALLPFINEPIGWACVVFLCELFNALRTSSQMPVFNSLVPSPRIARRFISISTVFVFILRTVGYSGGDALFEIWKPLPFLVCGVCQIIAGLVLVFLLYWNTPQIEAIKRQKQNKKNAEEEDLLEQSGYSSVTNNANDSPISTGSGENEHIVERP